MGVLIIHAIVAAAAAESVAIGSRARSSQGRIERLACVSYYKRYTMYVCMPVPVPKPAKDNYLGVLIIHAIVAAAAAAESVAIGSRARSSQGRIERLACVSYEHGGDCAFWN